MNNADDIIVNMIITDIEDGLIERGSHIFALNIPRLNVSLNHHLLNKGYNFQTEDNTGFNGEYSKVQTRYTISI